MNTRIDNTASLFRGSRVTGRLGRIWIAALVGGSCVSVGGSQPSAYVVETDLIADQASMSVAHVDPNLINPWGLAYGPQTYLWVADNSSGMSTVYDGSGAPMPTPPLVVTVPPATGGSQGSPTSPW